MIGIPAGEFTMGASGYDPDADLNEKPAHLVKLKSFAIGKYPITRQQWLAITGLNLRKDLSYFFDFPNHPMEWIDFSNAQNFCQKLGAFTGKDYQLPSEAQWEYACRAGTQSRFYWGNNAEEIGNHAWFVDNSGNISHQVGQKIPNAWGLYDVSGNIWEWCSDVQHKNHDGSPTDRISWDDNPENSKHSFCRGGSWDNHPPDCRSSRRIALNKDFVGPNVGVRVVYSI
jgi:formylglycine-generating enzyme required for sulfatase activity